MFFLQKSWAKVRRFSLTKKKKTLINYNCLTGAEPFLFFSRLVSQNEPSGFVHRAESKRETSRLILLFDTARFSSSQI